MDSLGAGPASLRSPRIQVFRQSHGLTTDAIGTALRRCRPQDDRGFRWRSLRHLQGSDSGRLLRPDNRAPSGAPPGAPLP